jgi:serine/threonine-protein phosphatase 2A regulatory subunit B
MNGGDEVVAASADPSLPLEWRFSQVFGERSAGEEVQEVDIISAIEFDNSGNHLATGDRGGRVVLFERTDTNNSSGTRRELEEADYPLRHPEFRYKTEFQSHDPEVFDLLCFLLTQLFGYTFYLSFHALSLFTSLITSRVWR